MDNPVEKWVEFTVAPKIVGKRIYSHVAREGMPVRVWSGLQKQDIFLIE